MAGAVVHLRHPVGTFESLRAGAVAAVDEDLAHHMVHFLRRHPGGNRLDAGIERLQRGGVHVPHLLADLADDDGARKVAAEMRASAGRKYIDDHRCVCLDRSAAAVVRNRGVGRAGDDHVGAREALFAEDELGASVKVLGGQRIAVRPQNPIPDFGLG